MENIRISLAAARVNAKLTQADVAREMKVSAQTILNWEKGKTGPTTTQARRLSALYNLPLDFIFLPDESN